MVGSEPGVNINIKGIEQFEFSNDEAKSNGGGSINLLSKIDSSENSSKKFSIQLFHNYNYNLYVLVIKYWTAYNILSYLMIRKIIHFWK